VRFPPFAPHTPQLPPPQMAVVGPPHLSVVSAIPPCGLPFDLGADRFKKDRQGQGGCVLQVRAFIPGATMTVEERSQSNWTVGLRTRSLSATPWGSGSLPIVLFRLPRPQARERARRAREESP